MKKLFFLWKLMCIMVFSILMILLCFYLYAFITPKFNIKNSNRLVMLDNNKKVFYESGSNNTWVSLDNINKYIIDGTVATEDKNFFSHSGFDYLRIIKALYNNFKSGELKEGASTISQQYIKNLFLTFDKTWKRKIEEAYLTFELEVHYSKKEILEGYLNYINYGGGNYGIEEASLYYFNKHASELSLAEASIIIGIPKNPTYYNPINYYDNAKKRQKSVLLSMVNNKYITKDEMINAYNDKLSFYGIKDSSYIVSSEYYKDAVISELNNISSIPKTLIETGGLIIHTNLDSEAQKSLEKIIKEEMNDTGDLQVGALIRIPKNGNIVALIGGKNYFESEYNRVTQAKRQVGSTIKPLLYYAALENGMTSISTFKSEKTTFNVNNDTYSPSNYDNRYANKNISMALALAISDNIYAVKTHLFLGTNVLRTTAYTMGINSYLPNNVSLALGASEINMLDYSNAFSTLANNGIKNDYSFINKVTDLDGNIIYEKKHYEELVLNSGFTFIINDLLSKTYNYNYIDYTSPTLLSISGMLTKKYAVKSGSTDNDYWCIGYNPDVLVMVWNGLDDNSSIDKYSSKYTKKIWAKTIEAYLKDKKNNWYDIPINIVAKNVNHIDGNQNIINSSDTLFFIKGTELY